MTKFRKLVIVAGLALLLVAGQSYARLYNPPPAGSSSGGSGTPGGSDTQLQYNNGGSFAGTTGVGYGALNSTIYSTSTSQSLVFQHFGGGSLVFTGTSTGATLNPTTNVWPYYKLHTPSSGTKYIEFEGFVASSTDVYFDLYATPGAAYLDLYDGTRNIYLNTNGNSYIESTGKFGIGTTLPTGDLHVLSTASTTVYTGDSTHTGCLVLGDSDGSGVTYVTANNGTLSATTTKPALCR